MAGIETALPCLVTITLPLSKEGEGEGDGAIPRKEKKKLGRRGRKFNQEGKEGEEKIRIKGDR